jgi:hypothetical protein
MTPSLLITSTPGYARQIGHLVAMLVYVRCSTLNAVAGLSVTQLDHLPHPEGNSMGALLTHIAALERVNQVAIFENRVFTPKEEARWEAACSLGDRGRAELRGRPLEHYVALLEEVRAVTLEQLSRRSDDWLYEQTPFWGGMPANNYFKWFHVCEDELSHSGQIKLLRKRVSL